MKRYIVLSVLFSALIIELFSLDINGIELSAGGGAVILPYQEGIDITAPGYREAHIRNNWVNGGIYAFFDARYIEIDMGYYGALSGNYEQSDFGDPLDLNSEYENTSISYFDAGILLKYPIKFNRDKSAFTPMIGFSYWKNLHAEYDYKSSRDAAADIGKKEWDQMWIKAGFGLDHYLVEKIYLRFTVKLDFPIVTKEWDDRGKNIEKIFGITINGVNSKYFGFGSEFGFSVGYRIK
jgi:hypothetical protein